MNHLTLPAAASCRGRRHSQAMPGRHSNNGAELDIHTRGLAHISSDPVSDTVKLAIVSSRNQFPLTQCCKDIEEGIVAGLIIEKAHTATLGHVGHHFDRASKIGVGMPG